MNFSRRISMFTPLAIIFTLLFLPANAPAGNLDSSSPPNATISYTLEDIYNRLDTGAAGAQSTFTEPPAAPTTGTMHDINEIMSMAPAVDDTDGATDGNVSSGKTYWGLTSGEWGLRTGTCCAGLPVSAAQYVFVELAEGNTDVQNAAALLAAYSKAKGLTPGAANRIAVIVPPGRYDLGTGAITLDTAYIDLIGLTTDREAQYIYGTSNGAGTGVLMQTADHVVIANLTIECTRSSGNFAYNSSDPAAYFPNTNLPDTTIRNCRFMSNNTNAWSMRISIAYAGTYEDCTGEVGSFGLEGTASGTFTRCTGWNLSFGSLGTAGGTFTRCTGGRYAFGGSGTASGTFTNCTGGNYSFGGDGGTASSGRFYYYNGKGPDAWAGDETTTLYCIKNGVAYP